MVKRSSAVVLAALCSGFSLSLSGQDERQYSDPEIYECDQTRLRVVEAFENEWRGVLVGFLGSDGESTFPTLFWNGEFVSFCEFGSFMLLDTSQHYLPGESFVINDSAQVLAKFEFGQIARWGSSSDGKLAWIQTFSGTFEELVTQLRVVDFRGLQILDETFEERGLKRLNYDGSTYMIEVLEPAPPG